LFPSPVSISQGTAGDLNLDVDATTLSGDITFGSGDDSIDVTDAATLSGNIDMGTGNDTFTVNADTDTDVVDIGDLTFDGAGVDALNLTTGDVTLNSVAGDARADFGANATVTLTDDISVGDLILNNASSAFTANIDGSNDVTTITVGGAISVVGSSDITLDITDTSTLSIGDSYTIISDSGAGNLASTFSFSSTSLGQFLSLDEDTTTADVYRLIVSDDSDEVFSDASIFDNPVQNLQNAATAIFDSPTGSSELDNLRTSLLGTATPQEAEDVIQTILPTTDGATIVTSVSLAGQTSSVIDTRLASIRTGRGVKKKSGGQF
jgi:hypothetical protein